MGSRVALWMIREPATTGPRNVLTGRLGMSLARYLARAENSDASAAWGATRDRLRRAGLRPVIIPRADLASLRSALEAEPAGPELVLGQSPRWTVVATGSQLPENVAVRVHDGLLNLDGGKFRLLLRCYVAPWGVQPDGNLPAGLRIDVVPQHEAAAPRQSEFAARLTEPKVRSIEDAGQILTSLALEAFVGPTEVLLLVPEAPDAAWRADLPTAPGAPASPYGDLGPGPTPAEPVRMEFVAGPRPPRPKTVGELILTDATEIADPTRRLILVVDPMLPPQFRLLPDSR